MRLQIIGPNKTLVTFGNGTRVFFSYETPVAAYVPDRGYIRTDCRWSVTTSKHITQWLEGSIAESVPQSMLDDMCDDQ